MKTGMRLFSVLAVLLTAGNDARADPSLDSSPEYREAQRQGRLPAACVSQDAPCPSGIPKIINGQDAMAGQFPWVASLGMKSVQGIDGHRCGGTLISDRVILTAAHCFDGRFAPEKYSAILGQNTLRSSNDKSDVAEIYIHPDYDRQTLVADVALVFLASPVVETDFVKRIALQDQAAFEAGGHEDYKLEYTVTGFGKTETADISATLRFADNIPSQSTAKCRELTQKNKKDQDELVFGNTIKDDMICAGNVFNSNGSDACKGDSGGGLILINSAQSGNPSLVGIVSRGARDDGKFDCTDNALRVGVYVKVATYSKQIHDCIGSLAACSFVSVRSN